jgi:O-antigen ligase
MIRENPITGVGLGNFKPLVSRYEEPGEDLEKIAHNTYIEVAAETGIPSLLVFCAILVSALVSLERIRRQATEHNVRVLGEAAAGIQAGLIGCMVAMFFISAETQKFLWLMLSLAPCLQSLAADLGENVEAPGTPSSSDYVDPQEQPIDDSGELELAQ